MELGTEKSATQKLESGKLVLERQNKELKAKLAELETAARTKTKVFVIIFLLHTLTLTRKFKKNI